MKNEKEKTQITKMSNSQSIELGSLSEEDKIYFAKQIINPEGWVNERTGIVITKEVIAYFQSQEYLKLRGKEHDEGMEEVRKQIEAHVADKNKSRNK